MRNVKQKLKRDPKRRHSSTLWLQRQLNDPYVRRAKAEGYRARSVYKLEEIDQRFELIKPGSKVIDLGAAPGSWSQRAARKGAKVVAIDLLPIDPINGVDVLQGDFLQAEVQDLIAERAGGPADVVLSDIAPDATGTKTVDRLRIEAVAESVLAFAAEHLKPEGQALIKLIRGAEAPAMALAKRLFFNVKLIKPKATRSESSEIYLLAQRVREGGL